MNSYADTSFLVSLYGRDVNSRRAIALAQAHHPVFMVTPFGEMEFTSIVYAVVARPKGWTVREARAIEENFTHDLQTGIWRWEDLPVGNLGAGTRTRAALRAEHGLPRSGCPPRGFRPGACRRRFLHLRPGSSQISPRRRIARPRHLNTATAQSGRDHNDHVYLRLG